MSAATSPKKSPASTPLADWRWWCDLCKAQGGFRYAANPRITALGATIRQAHHLASPRCKGADRRGGCIHASVEVPRRKGSQA